MVTTKVTFVLLTFCILQPYLKFSASGKHYLVETKDKMTETMTKQPPPPVFGRSSNSVTGLSKKRYINRRQSQPETDCRHANDGYYSPTTNINIETLHDTINREDCAYRCLEHPKCKFWSFGNYPGLVIVGGTKYPGIPGATWCYLKTSNNGWVNNKNWESGTKACGTPAFLPKRKILVNNELPLGYVCDQGECINKCGEKYIIDGEYDLNILENMAYLLTYNKSLPTYSKYHDNLIPCLRSCNKCCNDDRFDEYVKVCKYYYDQFVKNKLRIN